MASFYRMLASRMYYTRIEKGKHTPKPFFEIRVLVYLNRKPTENEGQKFMETASKMIDVIEWAFDNIVIAILKQSVLIDIESLEIESVDVDEFVRDLTNSFKDSKGGDAKLNEIYYYVGFHKVDRNTGETKPFWKGRDYIDRAYKDKVEAQRIFTELRLEDENIVGYIMNNKFQYWSRISYKQFRRLKKKLGY